ncbi:MAG: FAD-dependent monooxygenase, partial [Oscillospiraceae bacterium]|nr:FAD-dependent monooxygenase [Oscillospiraceae bacterium]
MLKIEGIKLHPEKSSDALRAKAAKVLRCKEQDILSCRVLRRSLDARQGVSFVYSVAVTAKNEVQLLARCRDKNVSAYDPAPVYSLPASVSAPKVRPVVVGAGPAGLFCALTLSLCGCPPILLERGQCVEKRQKDVEEFWRTGVLDPSSNVQFGEGGAGAFSDGKLNTGTKDVRHRYILEKLVECGAPEDILIDAKPHVGTDKLHIALINLRRQLLEKGCDIRFGHQLTDISTENGRVSAVTVAAEGKTYTLPCSALILAPGHSARDTFAMLHEKKVAMEPKAFAVGVRIEHSQKAVNTAQYKEYADSPALPASSYKLSCHLPNGRGVFSFCVCPGGQVVAAASEDGRVVTNGMSEFARDGENINGGLLVGVTPEDFGGSDVLAGIAFQRRLEEAAFRAGGSNFRAPAQLVGDLLEGKPSTTHRSVVPTYRPGVTYTDLSLCLPDFILDSIREALP